MHRPTNPSPAISAGAPADVAAPAASSDTAFTTHGIPFTWDPGAVGLAGKAFTADTVTGTVSLRGVSQPDGTNVTHWYSVVTGFSLNGHAVTPAGFGSSYGLYFDITDRGVDVAPPDIVHFTSNDVTLKADPGNHNGAVSADLSGVGFANTGPTGEADDITLASGSRLTGGLDLDLTAGKLDSQFLGTFKPAAGEAAFFRSPSPHAQFDLERTSSNPAAGLTVTPQPDGTAVTVINDFVSTAQLVKAVDSSHSGMAFLDGRHQEADHGRQGIGAWGGHENREGHDAGGGSRSGPWDLGDGAGSVQSAFNDAGADMHETFGRWIAAATDGQDHGRLGSAWAGSYDQCQTSVLCAPAHG